MKHLRKLHYVLFLVSRTEIKLGCVNFERNCSLNKRSITDLLPKKPFSPVQEVPFILLNTNYIISNENQIPNKLKLTFFYSSQNNPKPDY